MQLFDLRTGPLICYFVIKEAILLNMLCVVCEGYAFFIKKMHVYLILIPYQVVITVQYYNH